MREASRVRPGRLRRQDAADGAVSALALCVVSALCLLVSAGCGKQHASADRDATLGTRAPAGPRPKIVNGEPAPKDRYPFAVYYKTRTDKNGDGVAEAGFACGGSLIGERWVLTAAHCLPDVYDVKLWIGHLERPSEANGFFSNDVYIASAADGDIWSNPDYDRPTYTNDVALIRLDHSASQQAVNLVRSVDNAKWKEGTEAAIIGWGDTVEGAKVGSDTLRQATVPILDDATCVADYLLADTKFDSNTMLCAGGKNVDTCQGDSGGPLLVPWGDAWFQVGVVSWGEGCAEVGHPGVYSRLGALIEPIISRLESDDESSVASAGAEPPEALDVTANGATLHDMVQPHGLATLTYFEIRPTGSSTYTQRVMKYAGDGEQAVPVQASFNALAPDTEYSYRVLLESAEGVVTGDEKTFRTAASG